MASSHQAEMGHVMEQLERVSGRAQAYEQLKNQHELFKNINQSLREQIEALSGVQETLQEEKAKFMDQVNQNALLTEKINKSN